MPKKCLYRVDFSGKNWYKTLDTFLTSDLKFLRSRVEGCLYIYQKDSCWIKMINYIVNILHYAGDNKTREILELSLKNKFNLALMGVANWYSGLCI